MGLLTGANMQRLVRDRHYEQRVAEGEAGLMQREDHYWHKAQLIKEPGGRSCK